ncbi:MAG: TonB-dependent receptor [Acidobacteriota bacterium]
MKKLLAVMLAVLFSLGTVALAQETTGGVEGVVKDPTGANVANADVKIVGTGLIGAKSLKTDGSGYYRFVNIPPGTYTVSATATGFSELKRQGLRIEVGHLPTVDLVLTVGSGSEVVEVSAASPLIDVTQTTTLTNVTKDELDYVPRGRSFQTVLTFAPGAQNEPLQGGVQVGGAATAENSYLIEGMTTNSPNTGKSSSNAPFEFIQEVQVKTSGINAENGGAMGAVINVIQRHGGNAWHGQLYTYYEADPMDASLPTTHRFNPQGSTNGRFDIAVQNYTPVKDHYRFVQPGGLFSGYIIKDRLWVVGGLSPLITATRRTVNFSNSTCLAAGNCAGIRSFNDNTQQYFSFARMDYKLTEKIRLYGSLQYAYYRETGSALPASDSVQGLFNVNSSTAPDNFNNGIGNVQPNILAAAGADITITPNLVATTRFGRFYTNFADRGLPNGARYLWLFSSQPTTSTGDPNKTGYGLNGATDASASAAYSQASGFFNINANEPNLSLVYAQTTVAQDIAYFKKSSFGTHNLKFGYQLNHLLNVNNQQYTSSYTRIGWGTNYAPGTAQGVANCKAIEASNLTNYGTTDNTKWTVVSGALVKTPNTDTTATSCMGANGYIIARDGVEVNGQASSNNNSFYAQDGWTAGKGLTINAGMRIEKEYLPSYDKYPSGISFGWGSKIAPRLGASWDVFQNGKLKVFGSYGVFYDQIRLNLAIGSFGGNYWHDCAYALDSPNFTTFALTKDATGHYCPAGGVNVGANFSTTPSNVRFIENQDFRIPSNDPASGAAVDPDLKPYREHTVTFGAEHQLSRMWTIQASYLRTRLDHAIEDAGLIGPNGEYFLIVNPGEGVYYQPVAGCTSCKIQPRAARNYDGLNVTLTKSSSRHWFGQFVYTYSNLRGNYSGLTSTDIADGGGARAAPNNNRAFDEPFFQFDAHGNTDNGKLPTDRPNTFKAIAYYNFNHFKRFETHLGLFQQAYQGTPLTSYIDVNGSANSYPTNVEGRGKWMDITQDATGNLVIGTPYVKRTPMYLQSDGSFIESFKPDTAHESWRVQFEANVTNVFNHKAATFIQSHINSPNSSRYILPPGSTAGVPNYGLLESGYDWKALANGSGAATGGNQPLTLNSEYGVATGYQSGRSIRLEAKFIF